MNKNFFLSVCCGIGGSSIAAQQLGLETLGIELDPQIGEVYRRNVGEVVIADITTMNPYKIEVPGIDYRRRTGKFLIVQVSPECKKFSVANRSAKQNPKAAMASESANMLYPTFDHYSIWEPEIVVVENVRAYQRSKVYNDFENYLRSLGYQCLSLILNAANFGVPQTRVRLFSIFVAQGLTLPTIIPTHAQHLGKQTSLLGDALKLPWVSWKTAIKDLIPGLVPCELTEKQWYSLKKHGYKNQIVNGQNSHSTANGYSCRSDEKPSFTITTTTKIKAFLVDSANSSGGYTVRNEGQPCWTINASIGEHNSYPKLIHEVDIRRLSTKALARIQTFPDRYQWTGTNAIDVRGIGNAIPTLMMRKILEQILKSNPN